MITRDEIEAALQQKYERCEAETGLYDTGRCFVVMDRADGNFVFHWFEME